MGIRNRLKGHNKTEPIIDNSVEGNIARFLEEKHIIIEVDTDKGELIFKRVINSNYVIWVGRLGYDTKTGKINNDDKNIYKGVVEINGFLEDLVMPLHTCLMWNSGDFYAEQMRPIYVASDRVKANSAETEWKI